MDRRGRALRKDARRGGRSWCQGGPSPQGHASPIREVLCATDIERPARTALRYAFFIAEHFNASLSVVHAREFVQGGRPNLYVSSQNRYEQLRKEQHAIERLDALVRAVPAAGTGRATTHVVDGKIAQALVSSSVRCQSNLIVLGADVRHDRLRSSEETLAQQIGDGTLCPVVTVPHVEASSSLGVQRILHPLERGAGSTDEVLAWVALLARRFGAIVEILRENGSTESAHDEVEERLRVVGVSTVTHACPRGRSLAEGTLSLVERGACDLIVMSATSQGGAHSGVLAAVRCVSVVPVLSVRSKRGSRIFPSGVHETSAAEDGCSLEARAARGVPSTSRHG